MSTIVSINGRILNFRIQIVVCTSVRKDGREFGVLQYTVYKQVLNHIILVQDFLDILYV